MVNYKGLYQLNTSKHKISKFEGILYKKCIFLNKKFLVEATLLNSGNNVWIENPECMIIYENVNLTNQIYKVNSDL